MSWATISECRMILLVQSLTEFVEELKTANTKTVPSVRALDIVAEAMGNAALVIWITITTLTIGLHVLLDSLKSTMYLETGKTVCLVVCMLLQLYIRNRTFNTVLNLFEGKYQRFKKAGYNLIL